MTTFIALLRGINVGGHNKVPMAALRELCHGLGFADAQTYIQSGNVVFRAKGAAAAVEAKLEEAIEARFGFAVAVVVRTAAQWPAYVDDNPLRDASEADPNHVLLGLSKRPPREGAVEALRQRAVHGERIEAAGDALWFHYAAGVARSKLTPALIDRVVGSALTARNWRTVFQLAEMARAVG